MKQRNFLLHLTCRQANWIQTFLLFTIYYSVSMGSLNVIKVWFTQVRGSFLILSVFLVAIGVAFALKYPEGRSFEVSRAIIILLGVVLSHVSVNLFNEYSDYRKRIDFNTIKTPFSGGSGSLINGYTKPKQVLKVAIITFFLALIAGIYLLLTSHWIILLLILTGGISIVFYTTFFSRFLVGEILAGFSLGTLVVIGTYIAMTVQAGTPVYSLVPREVIFVSIIPGIFTTLLLLLNEFPDVEADKAGGRRHIVIVFGRKTASWIYSILLLAIYIIILLLPLFGISSIWLYLAFSTFPLALKCIITVRKNYNSLERLLPALGINTIMILTTDILIAISIILSV